MGYAVELRDVSGGLLVMFPHRSPKAALARLGSLINASTPRIVGGGRPYPRWLRYDRIALNAARTAQTFHVTDGRGNRYTWRTLLHAIREGTL